MKTREQEINFLARVIDILVTVAMIILIAFDMSNVALIFLLIERLWKAIDNPT